MSIPAILVLTALGASVAGLGVVHRFRRWLEEPPAPPSTNDEPDDERPGDDAQFAEWEPIRVGGRR